MRLQSPAVTRNIGPITEILRAYLPRQGQVLEVGSGPGEHAVAWAREFSALQWVPSDVSPAALASIRSYRAQAQLANLLEPLMIDLSDMDWGGQLKARFDAVIAVNVLHIAPWEVSLGLLSGAQRGLKMNGQLFVYGPFKLNGAHVSDSNAAFDASLMAQNPSWGVRDTKEITRRASVHGLELAECHVMPANNRVLRFAVAGT